MTGWYHPRLKPAGRKAVRLTSIAELAAALDDVARHVDEVQPNVPTFSAAGGERRDTTFVDPAESAFSHSVRIESHETEWCRDNLEPVATADGTDGRPADLRVQLICDFPPVDRHTFVHDLTISLRVGSRKGLA